MSQELTADLPLPEVDDPRQRAYLVALVVLCGQRGRAAVAAGISRWTVQRWKAGHGDRPPDKKYLAALAVAEDLAAQRLEDVAIQRASEGLLSFKFDKNGDPLRHPKRCECGHGLEEHEKPRIVAQKATEVRACLACTCEDFHGEPYYETNVSDRLIQFLLRGAMPTKYAERRIETTLRNINWDALPDHIVARLAKGENPMAVFASAAEEGGRLLESGAVLGGPGTLEASERSASEDEERADEGSRGYDAGEDL